MPYVFQKDIDNYELGSHAQKWSPHGEPSLLAFSASCFMTRSSCSLPTKCVLLDSSVRILQSIGFQRWGWLDSHPAPPHSCRPSFRFNLAHTVLHTLKKKTGPQMISRTDFGQSWASTCAPKIEQPRPLGQTRRKASSRLANHFVYRRLRARRDEKGRRRRCRRDRALPCARCCSRC
jgi:hypothetical protein